MKAVSKVLNMDKNFVAHKASTGHPIDEYVGKRLRERRILMGITQDDLGTSVGISFQQIQKYETGRNRISVSRLYDFANILRTTIPWFLEGYKDNVAESDAALLNDNSKETIAMIKTYSKLPEEVRKKVFSLMKVVTVQ